MLYSLVLSLFLLVAVSGCSNRVLVKKESCIEVFGGALLECEKVKRTSK